MRKFSYKRNVHGFTLVELMISMLLGLILTGGIYSVFTENARTSMLVQATSRIQENARFALTELVTRSRMIGYMGCLSSLDLNSSEFVNTVNPGVDDFSFKFEDGQLEVIAVDAGLPAGLTLVPAPAAGTHILVMRGLSTESFNLTSAMPNTSAAMKIKGDSDIAIGDIVFLSDCQKASLMQVTNLTTQGGTGEKNVVHNTGVGSPGNTTTQLSNTSPFGPDATVQKFSTTIYFIGPASFTNNQGAEVLSLWQKDGPAAPFELVSGVENMQIWSGEDSSGDGIPDRIVLPINVTNPADIVSLNITLTTNSIDPIEGNLLSRDFSASVKIRNRGL